MLCIFEQKALGFEIYKYIYMYVYIYIYIYQFDSYLYSLMIVNTHETFSC